MKILYVYDQMPGVYQRYLIRLLHVIQQQLGVKTLVYKKAETPDFIIDNYGFRAKCLRLLYKLHLVRQPELDLKVMLRFDIVHLQHSYLWQKVLPLFKLINRPKIVITLRGGDTYVKPWAYRRLAEFYEREGDAVDAFVVMSQHQKEYLQRWGVKQEKIHVIPISFGEHSQARPKYPSKNRLKLVSAFRMTWEKNIEGHVQFANYLKNQGIAFSYDIYGSGHDMDQLYFLIDKYGLEDQISVKGKLENEALNKVLPTYDFYVQLSISESLGMSVIEAQASGVPCVVSNSGGLPEVVMKDQTAIVGDYTNIPQLAERCIQLWNNPEQYFLFSENAIAYVNSTFTVQHELERLRTLYSHLGCP